MGADVSEALDPGCVIQNCDENDSVARVAANLTDEIEEFIPGVRRYFQNIRGEELSANREKWFRLVLPFWNTFLQSEQGDQMTEDNKKWIKRWLPRWNMYLQARAGNTLVTRWNICLTIMGFIFYIAHMASDIGTCMYYASNGQWWRAIITLTIFYGAVIIHTVIKWFNNQIHCIGAADWLRYVASSLVNWPDLKQYRALCLLEWNMFKSPVSSAHLVPVWHRRRLNVAFLKFTEGVWEACPQAILQLYLLVPDLYGDWTWTDYLRIVGASVSLCTAAAALVNGEKFDRINSYTEMSPSEFVVLHVWAVPVTVSRLLSVTMLLTVHPYWALAGVALHLILYCVYWCRIEGGPHTQGTLQFFMSAFFVAGTNTYRRVPHAIHFLVNTAMTVMWAFGTPLVSTHPTLYTAIICFNAVMFAVGVVGSQLHENYWPDSYFI